jgi:hypothetical protein
MSKQKEKSAIQLANVDTTKKNLHVVSWTGIEVLKQRLLISQTTISWAGALEDK